MEAKIIAAEIDLNRIPHLLKHKSDFNQTQVLAYLSGLNAYYNEAIIIADQHHLLIMVVGKSHHLLLQAIRSFADDVAITNLQQTTKASRNLFYKIVKGECWKDTDSKRLKQAIDRAKELAEMADSFGPSLKQMLREGVELYNFSHRSYTWQTRRLAMIKYPTVSDFDFEQSCLN